MLEIGAITAFFTTLFFAIGSLLTIVDYLKGVHMFNSACVASVIFLYLFIGFVVMCPLILIRRMNEVSRRQYLFVQLLWPLWFPIRGYVIITEWRKNAKTETTAGV